MLFGSKPTVYFQFLERSVRYLVVKQSKQDILDKGEIVFDLPIIEERKLSNMAALQLRLEALVKEKKWRGAKASVALSNSLAVIRRERVPGQLSTDEVEEYIDLHLNDSIRLPIDDPIFEFQIIEEDEKDQDVLIIAYPKEVVDQIKNLLLAVNLKVDVADLSSLSLYRLASSQFLIKVPKNEYNLIVQWQPLNISMGVFHDEMPTFNRDSQLANLEDYWELNNVGEIRWTGNKEAYAEMITERIDSIGRFMDFYRYSVLDGEGQITSIILTGDFPKLESLKTQIQERFNIPVNLPELPYGLEQRYAVLYGLSLREKV